jgi:hypothetical protein
MLCYSSKIGTEKIHKYSEERETNYGYHLGSSSQNWNEINQHKNDHHWMNCIALNEKHYVRRKKNLLQMMKNPSMFRLDPGGGG